MESQSNLKILISAADKSKGVFSNTIKNAQSLRKEFSDIFKISTKGVARFPFFDQLSNKLNKMMGSFGKQKGGTPGGGYVSAKGARPTDRLEKSVGVLDITEAGREDVRAAEKVKELSSFAKEKTTQAVKTGDALKSGSETFKKNVGDAKRSMDDIVRDVLKIKEGMKEVLGPGKARAAFSKVSMGTSFKAPVQGGIPSVGDSSKIGGVNAGKLTGAMKFLGPAGAVLGVLAGAAASTYMIAAQRVGAYRQTISEQLPYLQNIGMSAADITDEKMRFFRGDEDVGLTGTQRAQMLSGFAKQAGMSKEQAFDLMNRRIRRGETRDEVSEQYQTSKFLQSIPAFGFGAEDVGNVAGMMQRYRGKGEKGGAGQFLSMIGAAQESGMGGARTREFISDVETAVQQGVMQGSRIQNRDLFLGMMSLRQGSDERVKAIIPQIISGSMSMFGQAARMRGGDESALAYQAVYEKMVEERKAGKDPYKEVTPFDVQERLASFSPVENLKSVVGYTMRAAGGEKQWAAEMLKDLPAFQNVTDPRVMHTLIDEISSMKATPEGYAKFEKSLATAGTKLVDKRTENMKDVVEDTIGRTIKDQNATMLDAMQGLTKAVDAFKDNIQGSLRKLDETFSKIIAGEGILP